MASPRKHKKAPANVALSTMQVLRCLIPYSGKWTVALKCLIRLDYLEQRQAVYIVTSTSCLLSISVNWTTNLQSTVFLLDSQPAKHLCKLPVCTVRTTAVDCTYIDKCSVDTLYLQQLYMLVGVWFKSGACLQLTTGSIYRITDIFRGEKVSWMPRLSLVSSTNFVVESSVDTV